MSFKEEFCIFIMMSIAVGLIIFSLIGDIWYFIFGIILFSILAVSYAWYYYKYKKAQKKNIYMNEIPVQVSGKSMVHPETFSIDGSFTSHD